MKQLRWIFGLTAIATIALIGLQAYIWHQGIEQERERFSRVLQHAVYEASEEFMTPQHLSFYLDNEAFPDTAQNRLPGFIVLKIDSQDRSQVIDSLLSRNRSVATHISVSRTDTTRFLSFPDLIEHYQFELPDNSYGLSALIRKDTLQNELIVRHQTLCPGCDQASRLLSSNSLRPLLEKQLAQLDVGSDFHWGIQHQGNWLIVEGDTTSLLSSSWQLPFFSLRSESSQEPVGLRNSPFVDLQASGSPIVFLSFPNERWLLARNIGATLSVSTLLTLLVLGCLGYALFIILRQKQLSEVKTDFINNMTHELKTPISTISLACEAMQDNHLDLPDASRKQYLDMIATENERLGAQVEKVLQMALLDKKDLGLKLEPVDIHKLLRETIDTFSLQVHQRSGSITTALKAHKEVVIGDIMHLRQMLTNLLDNANKYSPEAPQITIETADKKDGIEIAIHDKGLGINRDALRKIFDRFYRVPTGNRHDVKGFGLGLSYVQTMALAHGGDVYAKSKPGAGSTFYLFLPGQRHKQNANA